MIEVAKDIKNTVIVPYEDVNRMINFCKDDEDNISRDFYDWYLNEKPAFFMVSGMLIVDSIKNWKERAAISFDFTNPDEPSFSALAYKDQSVVCKWRMTRMENLTMKDVKLDFDYISVGNFNKIELRKHSKEEIEKGKKRTDEKIEIAKNNAMDFVADDIKNYNRKGFRQKTVKELIQKADMQGRKEIVKVYAESLTYFMYALMYYVSKQSSEVIETTFSNVSNEDVEKIKCLYKYTGYVDLRENRIYKPTIERNPDDPVRDYNRHIQAWSVRGHYRRTKSGLIWIDPHIKGKGELEKRIYGTEDEKDVNLIPKVFEVERTVKVNAVIMTKTEKPIQEIIKEELKPKREHFLIRILRLFGFKK